jgi:hypothetical protein
MPLPGPGTTSQVGFAHRRRSGQARLVQLGWLPGVGWPRAILSCPANQAVLSAPPPLPSASQAAFRSPPAPLPGCVRRVATAATTRSPPCAHTTPRPLPAMPAKSAATTRSCHSAVAGAPPDRSSARCAASCVANCTQATPELSPLDGSLRSVTRATPPQKRKCAASTASVAAGCTPVTHTDRSARLHPGAKVSLCCANDWGSEDRAYGMLYGDVVACGTLVHRAALPGACAQLVARRSRHGRPASLDGLQEGKQTQCGPVPQTAATHPHIP